MHIENNDYAAHMSKVRKFWAGKLPDGLRAMFQAMPKEARFEHYREIDRRVNELYNETLRSNRENKIKAQPADVLNLSAETVVSELSAQR